VDQGAAVSVVEETAPSRRWFMLGLLTLAELLGMSPWLLFGAVASQLTSQWGLTTDNLAWLAAVVQLGFVAGTLASAVLNIADVIPARVLFGASAFLVALANGLPLVKPGFEAGLASRFLTGFFLAGVYPPAMKMVSTWFRSGRGLAIGAIVAGLVAGKAFPYLLHALGHFSWQGMMRTASAGAALAALIVLVGYRDGPHAFPRRRFSWGLVPAILRHRPTRLAIGGYLGHMWELYAMWTWLPAFLAASSARSLGPRAADAITFSAITMGALGSLWGGWLGDRKSRAFVANLSMAASGACALVVGLLFSQSFLLLVPVILVWGFFVVSDSAQFSAMVTEHAPADAVGTALTLQTSLGFLLSMATIKAVPRIADAHGWSWAFCGLTVGPALGILAIERLRRSAGAGAPGGPRADLSKL
jgi:sugar phosphate permease